MWNQFFFLLRELASESSCYACQINERDCESDEDLPKTNWNSNRTFVPETDKFSTSVKNISIYDTRSHFQPAYCILLHTATCKTGNFMNFLVFNE